jgi:Domain of unknown function (DUF1905)
MTTQKTTQKTTRSLDHTFTAPIEKDGAFATYVTVPGSAELLGTRRPVKVAGTIDGHPFTATLMPSGSGPHWLPLKAALCTLIGKDQAGAEVAFRLEERLS